jgi:Predicted membrane protein
MSVTCVASARVRLAHGWGRRLDSSRARRYARVVRAPRLARALAATFGALLLIGATALPATAADDPGASFDDPAVVALDAAGTGVDDFEFASFDAVYDLSRGGDGRSQLRTVETLVAVFPDYDQNRGIRRAIPTDYKGHSTGIRIERVTDGAGNPRSFEVSSGEGGFTLVTIAVPQGQYVHGEQTYVIEYTQNDVTATSTDLSDGVTRDEFYWDVNGTGWAQPFGEVSATVRVGSDLVPALTGEAYCYWGYDTDDDTCAIDHDGSGEFTASVTDLSAYQNMTVVVSFAQGTFAGAPVWAYVPILAIVAGILVLFGLVVALVTRFVLWRDARGRGIVIAQYEPAEGLSALLAANIADKPKKGMAASLVDLAVRKNLRILEHDKGWSKTYGVQRVSNDGLGPDEQRVMAALFSVTPLAMPGLRLMFPVAGVMPTPEPDPNHHEVRWLTKGDTVLGRQVVALTKAVEREVEAGGLRRKPGWGPMLIVVGAMVLAGILLIVQSILGGEDERTIIVAVVGLNLVPWIAIFAAGLLTRRRPLTAKGAELREHLDGLREFIRVAEADRLRMLQSVSGAERVSTTDGAAIVKIYERLLPYAVIFGLEKEWARELGKYYDENPPDWYSGSGTFAIATFASGISSLSSNVTTSYASSSGSSSSGGGGGGGSSGGGGGGGGGGGV